MCSSPSKPQCRCQQMGSLSLRLEREGVASQMEVHFLDLSRVIPPSPSLWAWDYPENWKENCSLLEQIFQTTCSFYRGAKYHVRKLCRPSLHASAHGPVTFKRPPYRSCWEGGKGVCKYILCLVNYSAFVLWLAAVYLLFAPGTQRA